MLNKEIQMNIQGACLC